MKLRSINFLLLLVFFCSSVNAQYTEKVYKIKTIQEDQTFLLNSKTRIGGTTRTKLKVDLPPNTVEWYYVFTTAPISSDKEEVSGMINLGEQILGLAGVGTGGMISAAVGGANIIDQITAPNGSGLIDVYVTDDQNANLWMTRNALGLWQASDIGKYKEGNRGNVKSGKVVINDITSGTVYLCARNVGTREGLWLTLDVAAKVVEDVYVDKWLDSKSSEILSNIF